MIRRFWRWLFGPKVERKFSGDWCAICKADLFDGEVWEVREHLEGTGEEVGGGGSWMAATYCREHAPDGAILA